MCVIVCSNCPLTIVRLAINMLLIFACNAIIWLDSVDGVWVVIMQLRYKLCVVMLEYAARI